MITFKKIEIDKLGDDTVWAVECDIACLTELCHDPLAWIAALNADQDAVVQRNAQGIDPIILDTKLTVRLRPVQSDLPGALLGLGDRLGTLSGRVAALLPFVPPDPGVVAQTAMVYGVSETGYLWIEPNETLVAEAFVEGSDWEGYWSAWLDPRETTAEMIVRPAQRRVSFHLDLTESDDQKRGAKMAAFIIGLSHAPGKMKELFSRPRTHKPSSYDTDPPKLKLDSTGEFGRDDLAQMTFMYVTDLDDKRKACEVVVGTYVPGPTPGKGGAFTPTESITKDYAKP